MKIAVAINYTFNRKMNSGDQHWREFNNSFQNVEVTAEELAVAINNGHAHCACHAHVSHRKTGTRADGTVFEYNGAYRDALNFQGMQTACLDFDGMRPEDSIASLLEDPLIGRRAAILYATSSSKPEAPRTRVVFVLEKPITSVAEARLFNKALTTGYPRSDKSGSDVMKAWSGSRNSHQIYLDEDAILPDKTVRDMIDIAHQREEQYKRKQAEYLNGAPQDKMIDKLRSALKFVPKQMDYGDWLLALMAVWSVFPDELGVAIIEEWSPGKDREVLGKFRGFRDVRVSPSWIFAVAYNRGWRDPDGEWIDYGDMIDALIRKEQRR